MKQDPIYTYKMFDIGGIPTVITEDHNEVFPFWVISGIRNATLLHIDYHHDMQDHTIMSDTPINGKQELSDELIAYTRKLDIANFICPAIHYGIFESGYQFNPYINELSDMGKTRSNNRHDWGTIVDSTEAIRYIYFKNAYHENSNIHYYYSPQKVQRDKLEINKDMILDIDLDAFLLDEDMPWLRRDPVGEAYEERFSLTKEILSAIASPKLITITRSQGTTVPEPINIPFVPPQYVNKVQEDALNMLKEVYKDE